MMVGTLNTVIGREVRDDVGGNCVRSVVLRRGLVELAVKSGTTVVNLGGAGMSVILPDGLPSTMASISTVPRSWSTSVIYP